MSLGNSGLRSTGGQYLVIVSAAQNNLDADVYESDDDTPVFAVENGGWSIDLPNSDSPRALYDAPSRDVDIRISTNNHDGGAIYFRVESPTLMWRIAFGDVDPVVVSIPRYRYRRGRWWGDYNGYYRTRYGRRFLRWYGGFIPAVPGFCVKDPPYVTYSQANQCICTSQSGYTIYKSNQEPDYDFQHEFALNVDCGGSFCSSRRFINRRTGCQRGCVQSTKITPYYCVGGTPAQFIPSFQQLSSVPRVFVQYRNGSSAWQTLYQQERKGNDIRVVAVGTKVDVYYGSYAADKWTFDATFQDTITSESATQHGIGGADVSEDYESVDGGIRCLWLQSQ